MFSRNLEKYCNKEKQKDINDRKTLQDKYKKYNNGMMFFSFFVTVIVIFIFVLLFDYKVLRPQDNRDNIYYSERTSLVSAELVKLLNCEEDDFENIDNFKKIDERLNQNGIYIVFLDESKNIIYKSEKFNEFLTSKDFEYALEILRERYIIEKHETYNFKNKMYFFIPKSDTSLVRKNFLIFIASIFIISAFFKWGFSRTIMKRVYLNMIDPLEKLKKATNEIHKGNLDYQLDISPHYNRELKDTFKDFEKMREKLKENKILEIQYESNRKDLISNISHDLKTPITAIMGYVEGLLDGVANTPVKHDRYMQIIYKKSLDMNRLVNDLILFSKLDVNKVVFNFEKIRFYDYMEILFEEYGMELSENGVELVSRFQTDENLKIEIDKKQLRRVFNNVIGNALKHFNKDIKAIEIMVYEENNEIVIRISDNGSGIPKDKVENIFDRFYKADDSRNTEIGSSGLGLSISKQIVLAHGGRIWATSDVGNGTIIYFTLSKEEK